MADGSYCHALGSSLEDTKPSFIIRLLGYTDVKLTSLPLIFVCSDIIVVVYWKSPDYCMNVVNGTHHEVFRHIHMVFSTYRSRVFV